MRPLLSLPSLLLTLALPAAAAESGAFDAWLSALRAEAAGRGISAPVLDAALADVAPIPRVLELDRRQPEFTLSFAEYLERVVPDRRVRQGQRLLAQHRDLLESVAARYHVQPRFIVALWGVETDFGRLTGGFPVLGALATLAWEGRRRAFFRGELLDALQILEEGHVTAAAMQGSWAGAMGQPQFMPSSFRRFAEDFDGDGRRDIWGTRADVFASAANYLARSGWRDDQTWGRQVRLPRGFDRSLLGLETERRLSEWQALGVRRADGRALPTRDLPASLVQPGGDTGPVYAVYGNYRVLMRWNRSTYFATAVGVLSDRIGGR